VDDLQEVQKVQHQQFAYWWLVFGRAGMPPRKIEAADDIEDPYIEGHWAFHRPRVMPVNATLLDKNQSDYGDIGKMFEHLDNFIGPYNGHTRGLFLQISLDMGTTDKHG
jgi:hypothetical protein